MKKFFPIIATVLCTLLTDLRLFSREKAHKFKPFSHENPNYSAYPYILLSKDSITSEDSFAVSSSNSSKDRAAFPSA